MDGFQSEAPAQGGSQQNDCSSAPETSSNANAVEGAFGARTEQWGEEALRHANDRQACIGVVNSGIARIVHAHQMAIEGGIENCKTSLLEEPSIQRAIAAHTGLLRQWHSIMSFQARLEQMRLDAEKTQAELELDPLRKAR
jgi:hypothetical protein